MLVFLPKFLQVRKVRILSADIHKASCIRKQRKQTNTDMDGQKKGAEEWKQRDPNISFLKARVVYSGMNHRGVFCYLHKISRAAQHAYFHGIFSLGSR